MSQYFNQDSLFYSYPCPKDPIFDAIEQYPIRHLIWDRWDPPNLSPEDVDPLRNLCCLYADHGARHWHLVLRRPSEVYGRWCTNGRSVVSLNLSLVIRDCSDLLMFASADLNRETVVWDRASQEVKAKNMLYHTARINCLAWSPDSSRVATGPLDMCEVDKLASTRLTIKGAHLGGVYGLNFTDDYSVASSGEDASIGLWNIDRQW